MLTNRTPLRQQIEAEEEDKSVDFETLLAAVLVLNEIKNLGDSIYNVRECEGLGWDGPKTTAYGAALGSINAIIVKYEAPSK